LSRIDAHRPQQLRAHIGKDVIFDTSFAIEIRIQECLYFPAGEACLDEEIKKLQESELAFVEIINSEQALTVGTGPREPSSLFLTVTTFHERQPSDSPASAQLRLRALGSWPCPE
jgi:hypothetical protein